MLLILQAPVRFLICCFFSFLDVEMSTGLLYGIPTVFTCFRLSYFNHTDIKSEFAQGKKNGFCFSGGPSHVESI